MQTERTSKTINTALEFIRREHPDIYLHRDFIDNPQLFKNSTITADMGEGKTNGSIALAHYRSAILDTVSIIALVNLGDVPQLKLSLARYNADLAKFSKETGHPYNPLEHLVAGDLSVDKRGEIVDPCGIGANFSKSRSQAKIVITIVHPTQLVRTARLLYQSHSVDGPRAPGVRPVSLIADEAHLTLFPHEQDLNLVPDETYEDTDTWQHKASAYEIITQVIPAAMASITAVTATPANNLFSDIYPVSFIIRLSPRPNYRNVLSLQYDIIADKQKKVAPADDQELHRIVRVWASDPVLAKEDYNLAADHPVFGLIQTSHLAVDHDAIEAHIHDNHPDKFVTIVHNHHGSRVRLPRDVLTKTGASLSCKDEEKTYTADLDEEHRLTFKDSVPLHSILQAIRDLGDSVTHLVLIAGAKVYQGRRINSTDFSLALTNEFLRDESSVDLALQKVRAVGYRPDNRYIRVHCSRQLHHDLITAYKLNKEVVDKLITALNSKTRLIARDILDSVKVLSGLEVATAKLPAKPMCSLMKRKDHTKVKLPMSKVPKSTDDFAAAASDYTLDIHRTRKADAPEYEPAELPRQEFSRLTTERFPLWAREDTKIARFLSNLDPTGVYSRREFIAMAKSVGLQEILMLQHYRKYKSNGYGQIMRRNEDDTYQLYPDLVESFLRYF